MKPITIYSILASLPILYPLYQLLKKRDLNLWDFLLLFSSFFFAILPAFYGHLMNFKEEVVSEVFVVLFLFFMAVLGIDVYYRQQHGTEYRILNICYFLRRFKAVRIGLWGKSFIALGLFVAIVYYLPRMSIAVRMSAGQRMSYTESSIAMALGPIVSVIGAILTLASLIDLKRLRKDKFLLALDVVYLGLMFFMPRRTLILAILQILIVYYSIHRETINKRFLSSIAVIFIVLYLLYFPFYNVIRWNTVSFNPRHPIQSLTAIVDYGIRHYGYEKNEATQSTDERTLGLYVALYNLFDNRKDWQYGELTLASIDVSIPRLLNPNKGRGTEEKLEKMTGTYMDQADSIMLAACGDFGIMGSLYAALLYILVMWLYEKYSYLFFKLFKSYLVPLFIAFELLSMTWNIEGKLDNYFSFFFGSALTVVLLLLLEKYKAISIIKLSPAKRSIMNKNK